MADAAMDDESQNAAPDDALGGEAPLGSPKDDDGHETISTDCHAWPGIHESMELDQATGHDIMSPLTYQSMDDEHFDTVAQNTPLTTRLIYSSSAISPSLYGLDTTSLSHQSPSAIDGSDSHMISESELPSSEDECEEGGLSAFERLPTELLQGIATSAVSDEDLSRLTLCSPILANKIIAASTDVWRNRFLTRYDYPLTDSIDGFAMAYKIRRFVLRKLDGRALALGQRRRAMHQMLVVRDMILETYNKPSTRATVPAFSKNLAVMSSPSTSPWILKFMACPLYAVEKFKYGRPDLLFDSIQVMLSHLVLSPRSPVLLQLPISRDNYNLSKVYNFNKPFSLMLQRLPDLQNEPSKPFRTKRFPNLNLPTPSLTLTRYSIDMHSVLHIRNFWQQHFTDDVQGISENTYAPMARNLAAMGRMPSKWDRPPNEQAPCNTDWIGHYSCLHPWPKCRQDLEERQSCAEDWSSVDPMMLKVETSTSNPDGEYWPPLFSTMPVFEQTAPPKEHEKNFNVTYIRGIAPFLEMKDLKRHKHKPEDVEDGRQQFKLPQWHPFLSSRVHGLVHDIPDATLSGNRSKRERFSLPDHDKEEPVLPGWKRIVMIIHKPSTRQLVSVLEHAEEDYGGPGEEFNTADIWNSEAATQTQQNGSNHSGEPSESGPGPDSTVQDAIEEVGDGHPTDEQIENRLRNMLACRIHTYGKAYEKKMAKQVYAQNKSITPSPYRLLPKPKPKPKPLPALWSAQHIRELEEAYSGAQYMAWDDGTIDYAYAYEGIIIPGGKIMLGRYWRIHGIEGMGPAKEVGPDGTGVEVRPVANQASSSGRSGEQDPGGVKRKRKAKTLGEKKKSKRQSTRKKSEIAQKVSVYDSDADADVDGGETENEDEISDDEHTYGPEEEGEYEFVTMLNGEESRAQNVCNGLDRGPFVFWATSQRRGSQDN